MTKRDLSTTADGTTRREFVQGVMGTLVGATALVPGPAAAVTPVPAARPSSTAEAPPSAAPYAADYPPYLQGIRGQNTSAMEAAHALRDRAPLPPAQELDEHYDLVVVGAGMSGLAAAYFYRKAMPDAKVLILDGCDDFGGHAQAAFSNPPRG